MAHARRRLNPQLKGLHFAPFPPTPHPMSVTIKPQPSIDEIAAAVRKGVRVALGRAITLIESTRPDDQTIARELL